MDLVPNPACVGQNVTPSEAGLLPGRCVPPTPAGLALVVAGLWRKRSLSWLLPQMENRNLVMNQFCLSVLILLSSFLSSTSAGPAEHPSKLPLCEPAGAHLGPPACRQPKREHPRLQGNPPVSTGFVYLAWHCYYL